MPQPTRPHANRFGLPNLGLGLGLRGVHARQLLVAPPAGLGWLEVITDNALIQQGWWRQVLVRLRERFPLVLHGLSLNVGGTAPLDRAHLRAIKQLARELDVAWVSDHLCWTGVDGRPSFDLLPIPYRKDAVDHVAMRIAQIQDALGQPILIENPSSYLQFRNSDCAEAAFLAQVAEQADCGLLLDVNNVAVSAHNHGFDPAQWLAHVPWDRVVQYHVAGPTAKDGYWLDTHVGPVPDPVWQLWADAQARAPAATLLEWDAEIPDLETVWCEAARGLTRLQVLSLLPEPDPNARREAAGVRERVSRVSRLPQPEPELEPEPEPVTLTEYAATLRSFYAGLVGGPAKAAVRAIAPQPPLSPADRLRIHADMYRLRIDEALAADFPRLRAALGSDWQRLCAGVRARLRRDKSDPALFALEQVSVLVPKALTRLTDVAEPAMARHLAELEWALAALWLQPAGQPVARGDGLVLCPLLAFVGGPAGQTAVWRTDGERDGIPTSQLHERVLDPAEAALLRRLQRGQLLPEALDRMVSRPQHRAALTAGLAAWLQQWAALGLLRPAA